MNLAGTEWVRRSDGVRVRIEADSDCSGLGNRGILVKNLDTGKSFWATPFGLYHKYEQLPG